MADWWLPILAKAGSTAVVVVLASALAEASGPFWGALVASLPVSAGPAYVFLAMQHDGAFVAASALSSFAANASAGLFLIVFALTGKTRPLWQSLGAAAGVWLAAGLAVRQIAWTPTTGLLLNLVVYGFGFLILRGGAATADLARASVRRRWFDLPMRAGAVAIFVASVVVGGSILGPEGTGIAAVFPISLGSLIVIVHPRIGGLASVVLAVTALRAMAGFGLALLALHAAIQPWGINAALALGLAVTMAWSLGLLVLKTRRRAVVAD